MQEAARSAQSDPYAWSMDTGNGRKGETSFGSRVRARDRFVFASPRGDALLIRT
jgi:hypothetical protein